MTVASFPLVLLLLLPGFLSINAFFLVGRIRKLSAFHGTTWSLIVSLLLVASVYPIYVALVKHPTSQAWPGLLQILENPALVPGQVWIALYVAAPLAGGLFGLADKKGFSEKLLRGVGIDLRSHGDIWGPLFRDANRDYVQVYLKDGNLIVGWPEMYSSDRSQPGPELYLSKAQIWSVDDSRWVIMEGVRGILLDASEISRVEFLAPPDENEGS